MAVVTRSDSTSRLLGRDAEIERLDALLNGLRQRGGTLVVRGEPGIGKSALLDRSRARASSLGARVLSTVGVESEAQLAFAGLHQLLRPVTRRMGLLPPAQRRALEAAFGRTDTLEPDPYRVALAAYQLVCESAGASPLLLLADDAQWLDGSSLGVLSFIARRLESEPVVLIAAVREGYATPLEEARLPSLQLERLAAEAAAELLDRTVPELAPGLRAGVLEEAAGNPLALVELARAAPVSLRSMEALSAVPVTLSARLERAFASRFHELPEVTRLVLLAAALDNAASLEELLESATLVRRETVSVLALDEAVASGLVDVVDARVRFRHPLIRSAVQQASPPAQVFATYGALAEAVADPERALWHRAMGAVGRDEEIAAALEEHAHAARRRGAVAVAAAALERAARLSGDARKQGERLVRAAELAHELGLVDVVRRLLREAEPLEVGELEAARFAWLREVVDGTMWFEKGATKTFVTIAGQMRDGGDADMALRSLVPIAHRCWWTRPRTATRQYLVDAAEEARGADDDPCLLAVAALAHPEATGPSVLRRVARTRLHEPADPVSAMYLGIAADKAGDPALGARFLARAVERLREQGRLGTLTQVLVHYAWAATNTGDWEAAAAAGAEAVRLASDTRQPQYGWTGELISTLVEALRGTDADLETMLSGPERALLATNSGPMLAPAHMARAAAALGEGRHADAFEHLWPVFDPKDPAFQRFFRWSSVLDLVESGGSGTHAGEVAAVVQELEAIAARSAPPILCAGLAGARPLLASDDAAEALFLAAFERDLTAYPFLHARTLFSFGRWLRRRRRVAESRRPLRGARERFDALGASRWSERARHELRATGEKIGPRTPDARDRLTAQELQIAQLAADGLSNREIGERLFLSHRTIGSHLYRIFPKLGITARAQLAAALARPKGG